MYTYIYIYICIYRYICNLRFSDVSRGYRSGTLVENGLIVVVMNK